MQERYSIVCKKIIEHYQKYINDQELLALNKIIKIKKYDHETILFINKIIDRIWQMTITKKETYNEGEAFAFLTTRDLIPNIDNVEDIHKISNPKKHTIRILTNENIINEDPILNGLIVEIDFLNNLSDPILPIDFLNDKSITINCKLNIIGVYHLSLQLDEVDIFEDMAKSFSEITFIPFININKSIYNFILNKKPLSKVDENHLTNCFIEYYLSYKKNQNVNLKTKLMEKYKKTIVKKYNEYFSNKITLADLINFIFGTLNNDPILGKTKS